MTFSVLEISDDVIKCLTKTVSRIQDSRMSFETLATTTLLAPVSVKNQISPYATLSHGTEGPSRNLYNAYIILTLLRRFLRVNDPLLR